ncbi:hypothetical protein BJ165DRAFT_1477327 [Panaeolus papilionaceus]|nr:hypothetical protein BJ165DRAFT_1477327 [Panaeolus papilionaceus]
MPSGNIKIMNSRTTSVTGNHIQHYTYRQTGHITNVSNVYGTAISVNQMPNIAQARPGTLSMPPSNFCGAGAENASFVRQNTNNGLPSNPYAQPHANPTQEQMVWHMGNWNMTFSAPKGGIIPLTKSSEVLLTSLLHEAFVNDTQ